MPFHNVFYGGEFYWISRSGATISVSLGPRDYVAAIIDLFSGTGTQGLTRISAQLAGWLWGPLFVYDGSWLPLMRAANLLNVLALAVSVWILLRWLTGRRADDLELPYIAGAALWAHVPMLFIFSTHHRYSMLAWDLSMMVLLAWLLQPRRVPMEAQPRAPELRVAPAS